MKKTPSWAELNHHEKYQLLCSNRQYMCDNNIKYPVNSKKVFTLDGAHITDIPSFYLSIGEAVNGDGGYFGACLDSLSDCLSGGFGVEDAVEILIVNAEDFESSLNESAWVRFKLETKLSFFEEGYLPCYEHLKECGVCDEIEIGEKTYIEHLHEIFGGYLKIYD